MKIKREKTQTAEKAVEFSFCNNLNMKSHPKYFCSAETGTEPSCTVGMCHVLTNKPHISKYALKLSPTDEF